MRTTATLNGNTLIKNQVSLVSITSFKHDNFYQEKYDLTFLTLPVRWPLRTAGCPGWRRGFSRTEATQWNWFTQFPTSLESGHSGFTTGSPDQGPGPNSPASTMGGSAEADWITGSGRMEPSTVRNRTLVLCLVNCLHCYHILLICVESWTLYFYSLSVSSLLWLQGWIHQIVINNLRVELCVVKIVICEVASSGGKLEDIKKRTKFNFMFGKQKIYCCQSYRYLGLLINQFLDFEKMSNSFSGPSSRALSAVLCKIIKNKGFPFKRRQSEPISASARQPICADCSQKCAGLSQEVAPNLKCLDFISVYKICQIVV